MKSNKLKRYMVRVFISYFLAIGIPITALSLLYISDALRVVRDRQFNLYRDEVAEDIRVIEAETERIYNFVYLLSNSAYLLDVKINSYENSVYAYGQLLESMKAFGNSTGGVSVALYIEKGRQVLSTRENITPVDEFGDRDLIRQFIENRATGAVYAGGSQLVMIQALPKYYFDSSAVFLFYLDIPKLRDASAQNLAVFTKEGRLIWGEPPFGAEKEVIGADTFSGGGNGSIEHDGVALYYATERFSELVFARSYSTRDLQMMISSSIRTAGILIAASVILVCLAAYVIARYHVKPVKKLGEQISRLEPSGRKTGMDGTIFDTIGSALSRLRAENIEYLQRLERNAEIVKNDAVRQLLWNQIPKQYTPGQFLAHSGIQMQGEHMLPILIQTGSNISPNKFEQVSEINILIKDLIWEVLEDAFHIVGSTVIELDQIVFVLDCVTPNEEETKIQTIFQNTCGMMRQKLAVQMKVVVGFCTASTLELSQQLINMRRRLRQMAATKQDYVWLQRQESPELFSSTLRAGLISAIQKGRTFEVHDLMRRLFQGRGAPGEQADAPALESVVLGNVLVALSDYSSVVTQEDVNILNILGEPVSWEEKEESVTKGILEIAERFERQSNETEKNAHIYNAKKYIHDNLSRDISLGDIAQYVGVNTSYFSRIFKANTGRTALQYMTDLRIRKAKESLRMSNMTIKEISDSLGYNDVRSFTRFFKKAEGCTPSIFRNITADGVDINHEKEEFDENGTSP